MFVSFFKNVSQNCFRRWGKKLRKCINILGWEHQTNSQYNMCAIKLLMLMLVETRHPAFLLGYLCGPVIKWAFSRRCRKVVSRGKEDTRVWYRETMFSQMVSYEFLLHGALCIGQIEALTCPPPPTPSIPRTFDTFPVPGRREFDYQSLLGGGEFDPHVLGVGNLNCTLDFMENLWRGELRGTLC